MSEIEQKTDGEKKKNLANKLRSKIWLISPWVFGVILILNSLGSVLTSPIEATALLLSGLLILPISYRFIQKQIQTRFNFNFKRWMSVCLFIIMLFIGGSIGADRQKRDKIESDRIAYIASREKAEQEREKQQQNEQRNQEEKDKRKADEALKKEQEQKTKDLQEKINKESQQKALEEEAKKPIAEQIANLYKKMGKPEMYTGSKVEGGVAILEVDMDKKAAFDTKHYVEYNLRDFKIWGGYISELPVNKLAEANIDRIEVNYIGSIIDGYGKSEKKVAIGSSMDLDKFKLYSFENLNGLRFYPAVKKDLTLFMYPKDRLEVDFDKVSVNL